MPDSTQASARVPSPLRRELHDAFLELHGRRLHGFALLLALGDRAVAARLAGTALAEGAARAEELRHPERAAAWLRGRVLAAMPRRHDPPSPAEEREALDPLGVDPAVVDGLAQLGARDRAALIATDIERLDLRDVETIVDRSGIRLERLLRTARGRFTTAYASVPIASERDREAGLLVRRIRAVAARTMT
jgi:hypothetical protein